MYGPLRSASAFFIFLTFATPPPLGACLGYHPSSILHHRFFKFHAPILAQPVGQRLSNPKNCREHPLTLGINPPGAFLIRDNSCNSRQSLCFLSVFIRVHLWLKELFPPHTNTIFVVASFSSQPRVGSAVTDEMSLNDICRPNVRGFFTSTCAGSHVCCEIFWCGAGL